MRSEIGGWGGCQTGQCQQAVEVFRRHETPPFLQVSLDGILVGAAAVAQGMIGQGELSGGARSVAAFHPVDGEMDGSLLQPNTELRLAFGAAGAELAAIVGVQFLEDLQHHGVGFARVGTGAPQDAADPRRDGPRNAEKQIIPRLAVGRVEASAKDRQQVVGAGNRGIVRAGQPVA